MAARKLQLHEPTGTVAGSCVFTVEKCGVAIRLHAEVWSPEEWARLPESERPEAMDCGNGCYVLIREVSRPSS